MAGWSICIPTIRSGHWPTGSAVSSLGQTTKLNTAFAGKDGTFRWFRARAVPSEISRTTSSDGTAAALTFMTANCSSKSMRDSAAELEKMVEDRTADLRRLSVRLMTMQDQEHRRIARELHDGLGQELAVAKMVLDNSLHQKSAQPENRVCAEASGIIDRAIQQVRTLSHLLHPPLLDEVGLLSAITWYVDGLQERSGIETSLDVQPREFPRLAPELETAIFRIMQEALTNVFRHSGARRAWVTLTHRESEDIGYGSGRRQGNRRASSTAATGQRWNRYRWHKTARQRVWRGVADC